jgi:AcrR family transcriptional regulator
VARVAAPNRVGDIVDAALEVFGRDGFSRAQMADVAKTAGVSVGTLYNYVEGKEALLLLCAAYAFDPEDVVNGPLPLTVESRPEFLKRFAVQLEQLASLPSLVTALARKRAPADVPAECAQIVAELFDLTARTRKGMDALERSARDVGDIAELFYKDVRVRLFRQLTGYIEARAAAGKIPQPQDAAVTARFAVESITWLARHRFGDPDGKLMDDAAVRQSTIELVTRAITGG